MDEKLQKYTWWSSFGHLRTGDEFLHYGRVYQKIQTVSIGSYTYNAITEDFYGVAHVCRLPDKAMVKTIPPHSEG